MFRQSVKNFADELGIKGFAENLDDGSVYVMATGSEEHLKQIISFASVGPQLSNVENISISWENKAKDFPDFKIVREKENIVSDQILAFSNFARKVFGIKKRDSQSLDDITWPQHVAIIPDGNRRWARERNLPTLRGHREGIENRFFELCRYFYSSPLKVLTLWCFSTENWDRSQDEVTYLMDLFLEIIEKFEPEFLENKISFRHIGRRDRLGPKIMKKIEELEEKTKDFNNKTITLAMDYGGRDEIHRAVEKIVQVKGNNFKVGDLTELLPNYLDTQGLPDPDLIIRTSEQRLSGFMSYQSTYSELYFTDKYFPDFNVEEFKKAILEFSSRKRRFGK
jgi:undecaprenyl diphosphate synthase